MQQDLQKENIHPAPPAFPLQQDSMPVEPAASFADGAPEDASLRNEGALPQDDGDAAPQHILSESHEEHKHYVRVLFVDDHNDMRAMMQLLMKRRAYEVETAGSAREALEIAPQFAPGIVVSDIGMPDMDGYDLMVALRADSRMPRFKSIALTGYSLPSDRERAWEAGFDACLSKPVSFAALFDLIDELATTL